MASYISNLMQNKYVKGAASTIAGLAMLGTVGATSAAAFQSKTSNMQDKQIERTNDIYSGFSKEQIQDIKNENGMIKNYDKFKDDNKVHKPVKKSSKTFKNITSKPKVSFKGDFESTEFQKRKDYKQMVGFDKLKDYKPNTDSDVSYMVLRGDCLSGIIYKNFKKAYPDDKQFTIGDAYKYVLEWVAEDNNIKYENLIYEGNIIEYKQPDIDFLRSLDKNYVIPKKMQKEEKPVEKKQKEIVDSKELPVEVMPLEKIVEKKQPSYYDNDLNKMLVQSNLDRSKPKKMSQFSQYIDDQGNTVAYGLHSDELDKGVDRTKLDERVRQDYVNAGKNLKNAGYGLFNFLGGILEIPLDVVSAVTGNRVKSYDITMDGIKKKNTPNPKGILANILYIPKKIIGDGIAEPINGLLDAAKGTAFAVTNLTIQQALDGTVNNIGPVRGFTDNILNGALLVTDFATNVFPGGDASQRVHSMDINNKDTKKKFPFVNNFYTATHFVEHGGQKTEIQNIGLRPIIETTGSLIANILFFDWLTKNGGHSHHAPTPSGSLEGGQYGGPGAGAGF